MPRITVQVSEEQREEWGRFVETTAAFESMSQLVRYAVEDTVEGWDDDDTDSIPIEMKEQLNELRAVVDTIETRTAAIETKTVEQGDMAELMQAVLSNQRARREVPDSATELLDDDTDVVDGSPASDDDGDGLGPTTVELLSDSEDDDEQ